VLNEFIAEPRRRAGVRRIVCRQNIPENDPQLALARSICTDRCAAKALVYLSAPSAGIS
jgi:hypothetical protein